MKRRKRNLQRMVFGLWLVFAVILFNVQKASADSYTYTLYDEAIPAPDAYELETNIRPVDLGIESFSNITDIFYQNGKIYLAMSGRIVVTDEEFHTLYIITTYQHGEDTQKISDPKCVYVTKDGDIYITEQDRGFIVQFDAEGNWIRDIGDPKITGLENIRYAPTTVVIDDVGRIYVKAKSVYEGIIELNPDGEFNRFVGANEVKPSFIERFYRLIATDEQISRMELWLPTDYSDIALDKDGFLMATVRDNTVSNPIRRLNSKGEDVMPEYDMIASPLGDYFGRMTLSTITTIAAADDGRFAIIDSSRSRIFVYSQDGILAYVLGGSGKTKGLLNSPVNLTFMGDKILVVDLVSGSIEVFAPTEYGTLINKGLRSMGEYEYEEAAHYWKKVYEINPNSLLANLGLGKYELRNGDYEAAIEYFKETGERELYSSAFEKVRMVFLEENLGIILFILIIVIIILSLFMKWIRKLSDKGTFDNNKGVKILRKIRYQVFTWPGYVITSPFKAFDDVKYENAGSNIFCFIVLLVFSWVTLIKWRYSGFAVNYHDLNHVNVILILVSSVIPYLVFIIANWAVGTLVDGKGNMSQIFKVTMYALYPSIFLYIIGTLISLVITYDEKAFAQIFFVIPYVLFVFYVFIGLIMVHQFTFTKVIGSILLTIVGMIIIIFVAILMVTLVTGFTNDVFTIMEEIKSLR